MILDYQKVRGMVTEASALAQQIIDARLALTRIRKTHPHPRLTIQLADQKLVDQVEEMQALNDELEAVNAQVQTVKEEVKRDALDLEALRTERAEAEKAVKMARVEDDARLVPLYSWYVLRILVGCLGTDDEMSRYTASTKLHRSMVDLQESYAASENELRYTYGIDPLVEGEPPHRITITLIFVPDTGNLAAVQTKGLEELGMEVGDLIEAHLQSGDVQGLIAAILGRARSRHMLK